MIPVFDLHCDLLSYLEKDDRRSAYDPWVPCSFPKQIEGGVFCQVMAIFTETQKGSVLSAKRQLDKYLALKSIVKTVAAIENASGFFEEDEPLELGMARLKEANRAVGGFAYVSMTWNGPNRFGGGCGSDRGLTDDGRHLIACLTEEKIPLDMSHVSDTLMQDIFSYIDQKNLSLRVIASHSNMRAVRDVPRNLPDEGAKEIIRRGGLIGLNLIEEFIEPGKKESFAEHVAHLLNLGGKNSIALGADFFYVLDHPRLSEGRRIYYPEYSDASCYQRLLKELGLNHETTLAIASQNARSFYNL